MSDYLLIGKKTPRLDGRDKVTGQQRYMTDLKFPDMLVGRVLRGKYPHAIITKVDYSLAEAADGVACILTAKDIPGVNSFGLEIPDQQVLCDQKVRCLGDPIALVIASTWEQATHALGLVKVDYQRLTVLDDPEKAIEQGADLVHDKGNILRHNQAVKGDPEAAFEKAYLVVENTYETHFQEHAFLETEGGIGVPLTNGGVKIYCPAQNGYHLRDQLTKILNLPEEKVIIVSSPMGGGFGGKYDIDVHALLALGAIKTQKPVMIHLTREESFTAGVKRQPAKIRMRTGVEKDGRFLAQEVSLICDTGAYASFGRAILSVALENCCGVYSFPHLKFEGDCVYTNNSITGAFRGFGNNQMHFALESQIDIIAKELDMDPILLRERNCLQPGARHSHGNLVASSLGAVKTLEAAKNSPLWQKRQSFKNVPLLPWVKRGIGVAICQQGMGLGKGIPEDTSASVEISEEGKYIVTVGFEELGQGVATSMAMIAAEALHVDLDQIKVVFGDTSRVLDAGPTTASRCTYLGGNVIIKAAQELKERMSHLGAELLGAPSQEIVFSRGKIRSSHGDELDIKDIGIQLCQRGLAKVTATLSMPETDIEYDLGLHFLHGYLTQVVGVEVNILTGKTDVIITEVFPDAGKVINPLGYEGQVDGGTVMGIGYALMEDFKTSQGQILTKNFQTYLIPTVTDIPEIKITPIEVLEESGPFGAKGMGEITSVAVTPAIINAITDATGIRIFDLPATPEKVYQLLKKRKAE